MPQAVKLSDALVADAKRDAELGNRSVAGQIEHWARLGRAIEQDLASPALREVTLQAAADPPVSGSLASRLGEALDAALRPAERAAFAAELAGRVRYGTDPAFPGYLVRDEPDGTRTPGRYVNRSFQPLTTRDVDD
jgi:hypothetical protein